MRSSQQDGRGRRPHGASAPGAVGSSGAPGAPDPVAPSREPKSASASGPGPERPPSQAQLARFSLLYESRDGSFCLFEDDRGHLHAVDARRLV